MPDSRPPDGPDPLDLGSPRRIHVIGVGGAGMSAIATVLSSMGHQVSGSDLRASAVTDRLAASGVAVSIGHRPENVGSAELVTFSPAVPPDNPELVAATAQGIGLARRSAVLAAIAATRRTVAVAGTHGKTTTSSMLSVMLVEAGLRPSFLIGADVSGAGTNAVWDDGEWLVLEADESYGTFQALRPEIAVLGNVEPDHLDHYGTFDALRQAFGDFLDVAGRSLVGADDPVAAALGREHGAASVGTAADATWRLVDVELQRSASSFGLVGPSGDVGRLEVPVPGLHNARNAALATVAALAVGATMAHATAALARFAGVPRRFEFRGSAQGVTFVDDYAHLPSEVRAALAAARSGGWARVVAVFQPHLYSRTVALAEEFGAAFADADLVVVTGVFGARERPVPGVTGQLVADAVGAQHPSIPVVYVAERRDVAGVVGGLLTPGDLCCTLGAGDLTGLPDELLAASW